MHNSLKRLLRYYEKMRAEPVIADTGLLAVCAKAKHKGFLDTQDIPKIQKWITQDLQIMLYSYFLRFMIHI